MGGQGQRFRLPVVIARMSDKNVDLRCVLGLTSILTHDDLIQGFLMDRKRTAQHQTPENLRGDIWLTRSAFQKPVPDTSLHQRGSIRKERACDIFIKSGSSYSLANKIHDLSVDGVFIEIDTRGLVEGDQAEVLISFAYQGRQIEHLLSAEVMRIQEHGVGLKFAQYSDQAYTDLVNLLYTK